MTTEHDELPSSLFKYREAEGRNLESVKNLTIWFAKPETFNDPFDSDPPRIIDHKALAKEYKNISPFNELPLEAIEDQIYGYLNGLVQDESSPLYNSIKSLTNSISQSLICCFSESRDNILQWSYYARSHTGFCIEYDTEVLCDSINLGVIKPINYDDEPADIGRALSRETPEGALKIATNLLTHKSICWEREEEYRLILKEPGTVDNSSKGIKLPTNAIKSITFGLKTPVEFKKKMSEAVNTTLYEMTRSNESFDLLRKVYKRK